MSSVTRRPRTRRNARAAAELIHALEAAGYRHGPPPHLSDEARAIDRQLCRRVRCPGCGKRRMEYVPFHRDRGYRVVARCGHCGTGEEL